MRRSDGPHPRPPRALQRLLGLLLSRNADCEFILGDLEEDFRRHHLQRGGAPSFGSLWPSTRNSRRREIGVRLALGARGPEVVRLMVRRLLVPLCLGLVAGTACALATTRVLAASLSGISPADPLTFGLVTLALAAVGLLSCYLPARRASQVDPTSVLRAE